jgi:hypothetical protein
VCIPACLFITFFALESSPVFLHNRTWALVVEVKMIMHRGDVVEPPAHIISLRCEERRHSIHTRGSLCPGAVYTHVVDLMYSKRSGCDLRSFSLFLDTLCNSLGWEMNIMGRCCPFVFSCGNCGDIMPCTKRNHVRGSGLISHNLCICLLTAYPSETFRLLVC